MELFGCLKESGMAEVLVRLAHLILQLAASDFANKLSHHWAERQLHHATKQSRSLSIAHMSKLWKSRYMQGEQTAERSGGWELTWDWQNPDGKVMGLKEFVDSMICLIQCTSPYLYDKKALTNLGGIFECKETTTRA